MKKTAGARIIEGLNEAIADERGELTGVRTSRVRFTESSSRVRAAPAWSGIRVAKLRARLKLSQPVLAKAPNVSAVTVRSWEQEKRAPHGAAFR